MGNWHIANNGEVMPDVEIMNAARAMAGVNPQDKSTDRGENLEELFRYMDASGWPGDPDLKPVQWYKIDAPQLMAVVKLYGCSVAWCILPEASPAAFGDDMLDREPTYAHAVTIVGFDADGYWLISWGTPYHVSLAWWTRFGRDCYAVEHP